MAVSTVNFYSSCLRRDVTFNALIPLDRPSITNDAAEVGNRPLKAIYLLNGFTGNHNDWLILANIRELSDIHNIAVFMPAGENSFYVDDEERGSLYGEYIGNELVSFTRRMFPISHEREDTFIGGLSMGGYGAIINGLRFADRFGKIIALSSAIIPYKIANIKPDFKDHIASYGYYRSVFGDLDQLLGSNKDPEAAAAKLKAEGAAIPDLYMACGVDDFLLDVNQRFHQFLLHNEINHVYEESEGNHNWEFWNKTIRTGLEWALKK